MDLARRVHPDQRELLLVTASSAHQVHVDPEVGRHRLDGIESGTEIPFTGIVAWRSYRIAMG
ncbi:MAG: hypothetical protein CBC48_05190 [bacterium TMED88]|nr:hypothetical protein [Deltaproteobacteria bacterium]OUV34834.1 MAG: hypothetical protein CBC48_05190 [bacterium TMED88]